MSLFISPTYTPYLAKIYIEVIKPKKVVEDYNKSDILILRTGKNIKWDELKKRKIIINHSPFNYVFTDKAMLALSYPDKKSILFPIVLGSTINIIDDMKKAEKLLKIGSEKYWILKPPSLFGGKDIKLLKNPSVEELADEVHKGWILQKYIENPALIDGKKFDIRFFVLETRENVYIYRIANLRLSGKKYDIHSKDMAVHLTNVCYQQKHGHHKTFKLLDYDNIEKSLKIEHSDFDKVVSMLKNGMLDVVKSKPKPCDNINYFELYGIDVMITANSEIFITEFNTNPAMEFGTEDKTLYKFRMELLKETFEILLNEITGKKVKTKKYVKV